MLVVRDGPQMVVIDTYTFFFTIAYTGLRRGEALGLLWGDVDMETSTLRVV